jgi:hypothetical protein
VFKPKTRLFLCLVSFTLANDLQGLEATDPTEPPNFKLGTGETAPPMVKTTARLILSAIIMSEGERLAIINNIIVKEGDSFLGMRVLKIEPYTVTVKGDEEAIVLRVFGKSIKEYTKCE